jgi:hypothetical protein
LIVVEQKYLLAHGARYSALLKSGTPTPNPYLPSIKTKPSTPEKSNQAQPGAFQNHCGKE